MSRERLSFDGAETPQGKVRSPEHNPLIVALDVDTEDEVLRICRALQGKVTLYKVGLELFLSLGRKAVEIVKSLGGQVFLDLKFYDIPKQAAAASREAAKMDVEMFTVHALGGPEMMRRCRLAAEEEADKQGFRCPSVLGVTILTSLDQNDLRRLGIEKDLEKEVVLLASRAYEAGLHGVVASPRETSLLRKKFGNDFLIVTPGVRLTDQEIKEKTSDQKRVATPSEAIKRGASYVVMGRSILSNSHPDKLIHKILIRIKREKS